MCKNIIAIIGLASMMCADSFCANFPIHEHGYWCGEDVGYAHWFDGALAEALTTFFEKEKAESVVDFGCGPGRYVKFFRGRNISCEGYDGNPSTAEISNGMCKVLDLATPVKLGKKFDWVLSLEVGEHIPQKYESIFIQNLHNCSKTGIVLSWAIPGQRGDGHFNEQSNDYIKKIFAKLGYVNDIKAEEYLRSHAGLSWFKNTVMVFRKVSKSKSSMKRR